MDKVLLIDTNISSFPIYDFLIKSGHEVFVTGSNPSDFLAKSVANYINIDYSDVDKMQQLVKRLNIDFIVPGCNDLSYKIASRLNSKQQFYGIDNVETTEIINNKQKFRLFAKQANLPVPKIINENEPIDIWPVIIKPADAYSGRGITIIKKDEKELLHEAIERAKTFSASGKYLIEQYIEGQLFSHSALIKDRKILIDFIVEEHCTANPFAVDTSYVVDDFPSEMLSNIRASICATARYLNLSDGLIHTQFIKHNNSFWLIEITRRCPGDLYSLLIETSTGFPYASIYAMPFLNRKIDLSNYSSSHKHIIRHTISQKDEHVYISLDFSVPVMIEKFFPLSLAGDKVKASPFGRIGLLFISCRSKNELSEIFNKTINRDLYLIK